MVYLTIGRKRAKVWYKFIQERKRKMGGIDREVARTKWKGGGMCYTYIRDRREILLNW